MKEYIVVVLSLLMFSCNKKNQQNPIVDSTNSNTANNTNLTIGSSYQGGIIGYILLQGDIGYNSNVPHGIVVASHDQDSVGMFWYKHTTTGLIVIGNTDTLIGTGASNTSKIILVEGVGSYPAKLCYDLVLNGYNDWFLPSRDELVKVFYGKYLSDSNGNPLKYWSSSEWENVSIANNYAYYLMLNGGNSSGYQTKVSNCRVRAVRYF